jgi:hypothetical protein
LASEPRNPLEVVEEALRWAVDYIADGLGGVPPHACEFIVNPEKGACDFCDAFVDARAALALVRKMRADAVEVEAFQTASVSLGGKGIEGPWYATSVQSEAPNAHIRPALLLLLPLPDSTEDDDE